MQCYSLNAREEKSEKVLSLFPCFSGRGRVVMLWAGNFVSSQGQAGLTRLSFPDKALTICPYLTLFPNPQIPAHKKRWEILYDV